MLNLFKKHKNKISTRFSEREFEKIGLKDITDKFPIRFWDKLDVTFNVFAYDKRFYGEYNDCNISLIFGKEREGSYGSYYNCKGTVYYGDRNKSFSYEMVRDDLFADAVIRTINTIIAQLKEEVPKREPEYIKVGMGLVERIKLAESIAGL